MHNKSTKKNKIDKIQKMNEKILKYRTVTT